MTKLKTSKFKFFFLILCVVQLIYIFHFRSGFKYQIVKSPFGEISGIHFAVSKEIVELNNIIKENKLPYFNLSNNLKKDTYFYQRSIEFNYPVRIKEDSKFIFFEVNEVIDSKCEILSIGNYLKLTKC